MEHIWIIAEADSAQAARWKWMQTHRHLHDQPERSERRSEELRQVVAGHVLDDLPARFRHCAIRECNGHPEEEVAGDAVSMAKRTGIAGGNDAADGCRICVPQGRIQRQHLPRCGKHLLRGCQRHPGLQHCREVRRVVLEDPIEPPGREQNVRLGDRAAPLELRSPASEPHDSMPSRGRTQNLCRITRRRRLLDTHRPGPAARTVRPPRPAPADAAGRDQGPRRTAWEWA